MLSRILLKRLPKALPSLYKKPFFLYPPISRAFASSPVSQAEKYKSKLHKALAREMSFEGENYRPDDTVDKFLSEYGYNLIESEENKYLDLTRQVGNMKVQISFEAREPFADNSEHEHTEECNHPEGVVHPRKGHCDFTVYLSYPDSKVFVFECDTHEGDITIHYVGSTDSIEKHKRSIRSEKFNTFGADFATLEEDDMQAGLYEYLDAVGVDEALALFVEHISLDKDQRLYMKFLKEALEFTELPVEPKEE